MGTTVPCFEHYDATEPNRIDIMVEYNSDELLATSTCMHHGDKGHSELTHNAALTGLNGESN